MECDAWVTNGGSTFIQPSNSTILFNDSPSTFMYIAMANAGEVADLKNWVESLGGTITGQSSDRIEGRFPMDQLGDFSGVFLLEDHVRSKQTDPELDRTRYRYQPGYRKHGS